MLEIHSVAVGYHSLPVLEGVTLDVKPGEIVALIGPNGSGKTTLLRAVNGLIPLFSGWIRVAGKDVRALSIPERARFMAVVPHARRLPQDYTVWQTVFMGRTPYLGWLGRTSARDQEISREALEKAHLTDIAGRYIGELSGGEQQLVLLARALAQDAPVLLLDEPTAHLDLHHQTKVLNLIRKLARERRLAVLLSLHDLNLVAQFSDRVALLGDGKVQRVGRPNEVLNQELLSRVYRVQVQVLPHPTYGTPLILLDGNELAD